MARKTTITDKDTAKVLNTIRANASEYYKNRVPRLDGENNLEGLKEIGQIICDDPALSNEYLLALSNRIGMVLIGNRVWENVWQSFIKGKMEFGDRIEEIYVDIAKPFKYDVEKSPDNVFKRHIPDVKSAFHLLNWQTKYKATIDNFTLRQAFMSYDGQGDLVSKIIDSMSTGLNYDIYQTTKYLLARSILAGHCNPVEVAVDAVTGNADVKDVVKKARVLSDNWLILNRDNNPAGVMNSTKKEDQYIIINNSFTGDLDVDVLASAFNMSKTEFFGHRVPVDSFAVDNARLTELFTTEDGVTSPAFVPLTDAEISALNAIPAVMVQNNDSCSFFQIYTNLHEMEQLRNPDGLSWLYWLHEWMIFSVSPFAQRAVFVPTTPAVNSVAVAPVGATLTIAGQQLHLTATVSTTGFAPTGVQWTSDAPEVATVDPISGVVTAIANGTAHIAATSTFDSTKYNTAEITVSIA